MSVWLHGGVLVRTRHARIWSGYVCCYVALVLTGISFVIAVIDVG
ncbi:hypothetical protein PJE062_952 [Pseudovibrio sp. JE062]|nr:hypothetical protein PJE062_952 [Pseudovibrio sp. JE062]